LRRWAIEAEQNGRAQGTASRLASANSEESPSEIDEVVRRVACSPARPPFSGLFQGMRMGASGRYVIERRIGAGGMGTVYEAKDELLQKVVALKVLHRGGGRDDEAPRALVLREARLASRVDHERVARVFDVGEHEGDLFVAMEFVRGTTLRSLVNKGRTPAFYALKIAIGIAEGLAALHDRDVIHRDLKPENVMVSQQGGVKLLDFGLARQYAAESPLACPGAGGSGSTFSGTPGYMAPEVVEGRSPDPRVDVFALGVIVYELVTGSRPFAVHRPLDILTAVVHPPVFSREFWDDDESKHYGDLAVRLREITARMLSRNPESRFTDGWAALQALQYGTQSKVSPNRVLSHREFEANILWVDDQPKNNEREIRNFERVGLRVTRATSTATAMRHLYPKYVSGRGNAHPHPFRAVISDMAREEGPREGFALLDALRQRGDSTPFFIYSRSTPPERQRESADRGGQGCTDDDAALFEMVMRVVRVPGRVGGRVEIVRADITTLGVDAVVNATDETLLATGRPGSVTRAIHRAAGSRLRAACRALGGCAVGDAKLTESYGLKAGFVIHTVGPFWSGGAMGEESLLASCYARSLALAAEHGVRTIAFPCISTGAFGYPVEAASRVAVRSVASALARADLPEKVTLCAFSSHAVAALEVALNEIARGSGENASWR
jgi:serine/threonine protein kinase/O-acetyl-ADP-ribose deacetylase (regulator of RNase III)